MEPPMGTPKPGEHFVIGAEHFEFVAEGCPTDARCKRQRPWTAYQLSPKPPHKRLYDITICLEAPEGT